MPLVGVVHLGLRSPGHRGVGAQRTDTPDAQQHLLEQPVVGPAAVEPVGHPPLGRLVVLDVRVEQQQRDPSDLRLPDLRVQRATLGQTDGHLHRHPRRIGQLGQGEPVRVDARVPLLLPAVPGQRLHEVPGPVEQADADDRHAEVARGLEMVAGEDAEAAGVLRQHLGDTELRGEVGDRRRGAFGLPLLIPQIGCQVLLEVVRDVGEPAHEPAVGGQREQPVMIHLAEQADRVSLRRLPELRINRLEQVQRLGMPGPAKIQD